MSWTIRLNRFVYIFFYCLMEWILSPLQKRRRIYFQSTRIAFCLQWPDWFSQTFHDLIRTIWVEPNRRQMHANIRLSTEKMSRTESESNRFQAVRLRSVKSTDLCLANWSIDSTQLNWLESNTLKSKYCLIPKIRQCSNRRIINLWLQISKQSETIQLHQTAPFSNQRTYSTHIPQLPPVLSSTQRHTYLPLNCWHVVPTKQISSQLRPENETV